jgi:anti-anti-sigma factor
MTIEPALSPTADQDAECAPAQPIASARQERADGPEGTAVLVSLPAEIDVSNDGQVRELLADALDRRPAVLIADGSQTTFCGCSGVRVLLEAHHRAAAAGAQLRLVAPAAEVRRILQPTGADSELCVCPSLEAAVLANGVDPTPDRLTAASYVGLNPAGG